MTRPRLALVVLAADLALAPTRARADLSHGPASLAAHHLSPGPAATYHLSPGPAQAFRHLSPGPAAAPPATVPPEPAAPSASERDLAYELGVQAEASDPPRAAAAYERAYRLTPAAETGPRLLFLRASVAARLRADTGDAATRVHLCHAQVLLRDYLADPALAPELRNAEQQALDVLTQRLALAADAPPCATLLGLTPAPVAAPPATSPPPATTPATRPGPEPGPEPAPAPTPTPAPLARPLRISGAVGLGVGVGGLALLVTGIYVARHANTRGHNHCVEAPTACTANDAVLRDIATAGHRGDALARAGAVMAGLGLLAGISLLAFSARKPPPRRATLHPAGAGLGVRF